MEDTKDIDYTQAFDAMDDDAVRNGIGAIYDAGFKAGWRCGHKEGFCEGRRALSGDRVFLTVLLVFTGAAAGAWLFGVTLDYARMFYGD